MQLASDIRTTYRRTGIAAVPGFAIEQELERIARDISNVFLRRADALGIEAPRGSSQRDMTAQLKALFRHSPKEYVASAKFAQHLASVHRLGVSDAMLEALAELGIAAPAISTRPVIHFMTDDLRIEGGYHKTPIHQDWRSVQGSVDGVTMWMPLFDVTLNDYPLEILPGSHRRGLLPSADHAFGHQVEEGAVDEAQFVGVPLERGTAAFFSGFLAHRTGTQGGERVRVALSYRFNNAEDPSFVSRGYPDTYVYKAEKPLLNPEFPPQSLVEKTFPTE
ncbi:MAG: phytanoyl-CoA dioxygenase family protein [Candidatus Aquilonibacter sp.]